MNNWIYFFVTRPIATIALYSFIFISGLSALMYTPIESEPEINKNEIQIHVNYSSALDAVLNSVAIPLEKKLLAIEGIDLLTTQVTNNNVLFTLFFVQNSDMNSNMIRVQSAVSEAKTEMPPSAHVVIPPVRENNAKIMAISFSSETQLPEEVQHSIEKFKSVFETIEGVSSAAIGGSDTPDICNIMLRPADMNSKNISFHDFQENLRSLYIQGGSSDITVGNNNISLEIGYEDEQDILLHPIYSRNNNNSTYLYEIADVKQGNKDNKIESSYRLDGKRNVMMEIYKKQEANLITVCKSVRQKYEQIKPSCIRNGIKVDIVQDKSLFVNKGINSIYHAIMESIVLVSIIIFIFLRSIILSIIPIIAIPMSIIPTFCAMKAFNVSINVFSLFGIVIAIGLVVDDAIVVIENIHKYNHMGLSKLESALKGTSQIVLSIISMTITLAIVYLPILVTSDPYIKAFFDFAFIISVSVIISGFISITLTPMLYHLLYQEGDKIHKESTGFLHKVEQKYLSLLCFCMTHRNVIIYIFTTVATCSIIILVNSLKHEEEVHVDRGMMFYTYNYKTENNLDVDYIDEKLLDLQSNISNSNIASDIKHIVTSTSQRNSWQNYVELILQEHSKRKYDISQILQYVQDYINQTPSDLNLFNMQSTRDTMPVTINIQAYENKNSDELNILMYNFDPIRELAQQTFFNDTRPRNCYMITINRDLCRLYNILPFQIADMLTAIKQGQYFRESVSSSVNKISFGLSCLQQEEQLEKILDLPIRGYTQDDHRNIDRIYPLRNFATVKNKQQMSKYYRILGNPGTTFTIMLKEGKSIKDLKKAVDKFNQAYAGVAYAEINITELRKLQSLETIFKLAILSIIFIYLLLSALFESFIKPIIILSIVPSSAAGGLLLLYMFSLKINTISIIGIITLIGLIAKHGIMLIDYSTKQEHIIKDPDLLIINACLNRFRPILMTTACMILGAIPLVIHTKVELIEYKLPVALVIIGGTGVGTLVTLLILPIYYVVIQELLYGKNVTSSDQYIVLVQSKLKKYKAQIDKLDKN